MRRLLYYSLLCLLWVSVDSCKDDEVAAPPKPSFTVDKTSGLYNATEFTFTIDQVEGNISLLPYGLENPNFEGINVPASSFTNGKASVKFTYAKVGTYNAVVVANNHSTDGQSIKNVYSDPTAITITSDQTAILTFSFKDLADGTIKDKVKTDEDSISITVPYGTDLTKVKPVYTSSDFSTVAASGTDFSSPVSYVVTSQDGLKKSTYVVRTTVTPVEKLNSFKSFSAILSSASGKGKALAASVDSVAGKIVIYDTLGASTNPFDSVELAYELRGKFAYVRYANNKHVASGDTLDLSTHKTFTVVPQDSTDAAPLGKVTYDLYAVGAPKLTLAIVTALNPTIDGVNSDFTIDLRVLKGTDVETLNVTPHIAVGTGVTVTSIKAVQTSDEAEVIVLQDVPSVPLDFSKPIKFELTVNDSNIGVTYTVVYTAKVTVLK